MARAVFRPANFAIQTLAPLPERSCAERPAAHGQEPGHRLYATCDFDIVEVVEIDRDHHDSTRRVIGIDPKTVQHDRPPDHGVIPERPGLIMNHKKLYPLYREEGLSVRRRRGREQVRGSRMGYLAGRDRSSVPQDLPHHACIHFRFTRDALYLWDLERDGKPVNVEVQGPMTLGNANLVLEAALSGIGGVMSVGQYPAGMEPLFPWGLPLLSSQSPSADRLASLC